MDNRQPTLPIRTVIIKVTNECNLRCAYCFVEPTVPRSVIVDQNVIRRLLDQLESDSTESTIHLVWHGGEPTLAKASFYRRMKELQAGRSKVFENLIQTNGTLLTDAYVSTLKELGFSIGLSLDGPRGQNDLARVDKKGNGTFSAILRAMETLKRHEVPFGILATIAKHNVHDADKLYSFCKEHDVALKLSPLYHSGQATCNLSSLNISIDEYRMFTQRLATLWLNDETPLKIDPIEPLLVNTLGGSVPTGCAFSGNCHHHFLGIGPTGDLYPCGLFQGYSEYRYGNIFTTSLKDIAATNVFHRMEGRSRAIAKKCASCAIYEHCHGGCPFHAMVNMGSLYEQTPLCRPYKESVATIVNELSSRLCHSQPN